MTYSFTADIPSFRNYPKLLSAVKIILAQTNAAASEKEYNVLIHDLLTILNKEKLSVKPTIFTKEISAIHLHSPLIEKTPWGYVSIKKVDTAKNFIQKLLVIKSFGILGFELHKKKVEKLYILEGICLILSSQHKDTSWKKGKVTIALGKKGTRVVLNPKDEHGIIALTNCVIEETSTNNLDDLVFVFPSKQLM